MSLLNLRSVFQDELENNVDSFQSNQPAAFETKLNYNIIPSIAQTFTFDVENNPPILDSVLRGRVYDQIRFSQNFSSNTSFVIQPQQGTPAFRTDSFDPRSSNPKDRTLYFNTNQTLGTSQYGEGGFFTQVPSLGQDFNNNSITDFSTSGFKGAPYTRLSTLGDSPLDGLNWEDLYNGNHTPKDNPTHQGISAVNYGPNVNRDKLDIRDSETKSSLYNLSRTSLLFPNQGEPYIVSDIAPGPTVHSGGRLLNQGSLLGFPINRMITDTARISKFLTSPKGLGFIAAQNFLGSNSKSVFADKVSPQAPTNPFAPDSFAGQAVERRLAEIEEQFDNNAGKKELKLLQSRQRFKQTFNPASTLAQTLLRAGFGPIVLNDKTEPNFSILDRFASDEYGGAGTTVGPSNFNDTFNSSGADGGFGLKKFASGLISAGFGQTGVPSEAKRSFPGSGDKMTLAPMIRGTSLDINANGTDFKEINSALQNDVTTGAIKNAAGNTTTKNQLIFNIEAEKEGMPFYFKDLRDNTYIFFRAFIEGLTENISPSYAPTNYIGRSEPVYTYERAERELSFTLKLVAQTALELDSIYGKMNRLTSLCYPQYQKDDYGNRMKPPLTKFRMGELFGKANKELRGYIKSVSYSVDQSSTYETEVGKRVPRHVTATIGYQVIHDKAPNKNTKFYGIVQ